MERWSIALLALAACGSPTAESGDEPPLPWPRERLPAVVDGSTPAQRELGRLLFYDPILSADYATACATCHSELWGLSDGLAVSVGVDGEGPTGPGRRGPNITSRNAQTLWNVGLRERLFWDGRSDSLEAQALEPIVNDVELGRASLDAMVADVAGVEAYRSRFAAAFGDEVVTAERVGVALAAFQRTFVSAWSPYDRYVAGDAGALSVEAVAGMDHFAAAGCADCHTPPRFEREAYAARGIGDDPGRVEVTGDEADRGAFRVPTLRNLRETGPFFHDGSVQTLEEAVAHEVARSGDDLDAEAVAAIATFLRKALVDRSFEPDRPEEVPSGLPVPLDGFRIPR